jgi:dephospho-CoA kinase
VSKALQIGITGGIGSGKSLACKIFKTLNVPVYDADSRAKSLMTTDGILISAIKKEFGDLAYDEAGNLNRQHIAKVVFQDESQLAKLNAMVHPRVAADFEQWVQEHNDFSYVLKEAALLYEAGSFTTLDKMIVVFAPVEIRLARVLVRDAHRSESQIKDIMQKQWDDEDKIKRADFVLYNDEKHLLIPQVLSLHQQILNLDR